LLAGPIFSREALTSPRSFRHYLLRSGYVAVLFLLMYTTRVTTFGWQEIRNVGDAAGFGTLSFQIFSIVQLTLVLFFALLLAAGAVAQEKDRQTLILLLMTDLRDRELVLGKLLASLLLVGVLLATSVPVFVMLQLLGGVSLDQIGWALGLCAATALVAGSWGSLVAFWREKTFQTLAISVIGVVLFLGTVEAAVVLAGTDSAAGKFIAQLNPYRALMGVLDPLGSEPQTGVGHSALGSVLALSGLALLLNLATILRLRIWNPSKSVFQQVQVDKQQTETKTGAVREVWENPVIWREIRTRAYGRKVFVIKLAYVVVAAFAMFYFARPAGDETLVLGMVSAPGFAFVGLTLISLMIINSQAVTSLTSERDGKTLELLLVTDVTAREFIFGKLGGILYNTKELIIIPLLLVGYYAFTGGITLEQLVYLVIGFLVLLAFTTMLGLHSGLSYDSSRAAIANSLGTIFFLSIGVFIFMILLVETRTSFMLQLPGFLLIIGAGSLGLWASLTHKNPSNALTLAAGLLPFLTFYAITEFLLDGTLGVCLAIGAAYGFATLAMLIPAVSEFDVALGRTTLDKG